MKRWIFFLGAFLIFGAFGMLPPVAGATYTQYKECTIYNGACDDFVVDPVAKTISFSFNLKSYYQANKIVGYSSIRLVVNENTYYRGGYVDNIVDTRLQKTAGMVYTPEDLARLDNAVCDAVLFGTSPSKMGTSVDASGDDTIFVKGTGCAVVDGGWLRGTIIITPEFLKEIPQFPENAKKTEVADKAVSSEMMIMPYPQVYQEEIRGEILKYVEGPETKKREQTEKIVRFIPLLVIAGISLLGLIRVTR